MILHGTLRGKVEFKVEKITTGWGGTHVVRLVHIDDGKVTSFVAGEGDHITVDMEFKVGPEVTQKPTVEDALRTIKEALK